MTVGIEPLVWTAGALLVLTTLAFVGATVLPPFLLHEGRSKPQRHSGANVTNGRVFCRVNGSDIDLDQCLGCPHLRVFDGRGSFIVCDGRATPAIAVDL